MTPASNFPGWPDTGWWRLDARARRNNLLVVFSALYTPHRSFSWSENLENIGADILFLNCPDNGGFLGGIPGIGDDIDAAAKAIGELARHYQAQGGRVVFFGASMGALGAVMYAGVARPDAVVALSPEVIMKNPGGLSTRFLGSHRGWLDEQARMDDMLAAYRGHTRLIAGTSSVADVRCARHYGQLQPQVDIELIANVHHNVVNVLTASQQLRPMLRAALADAPHELPPGFIDPRVPSEEKLAPFHEGLYAGGHLTLADLDALLESLHDWPQVQRAWGLERLLSRAMEAGSRDWSARAVLLPLARLCGGIEWNGLQARLAAIDGDPEAAHCHLLAATQYPDALYAEPLNLLWRHLLHKQQQGAPPMEPGKQPKWFQDRLATLCREFGLDAGT